MNVLNNIANNIWSALPWNVAEEEEPEQPSIVVRFLCEKTRLFDIIPNISEMSDQTLYTLLKGAVQSGKSRLAYAILVYLAMEKGHNVCMILRDYTGDYVQFRRLGGLEPFLQELNDFVKDSASVDPESEDLDVPPIFYMGDIGMSTTNVLSKHTDLALSLASGRTIVLALANAHQIGKLNEVYDLVIAEGNDDMILSVVIDEADQLMYSEGHVFSPRLDSLLEKCRHVYGISATVMDNLHDGRFSTSNVYVMTPPPDYKGIKDIHHKSIGPIDDTIKKEAPDEFFRWDPSFLDFLMEKKNMTPHNIRSSEKHPIIALVKTERLICHQDALLNAITTDDRFRSAFTVIVYNGDDTKLYSPSLIGRSFRLPICCKKQNLKKSTDRVHVFRQCAIQYVLQYLKQNGGAQRFPRILIISHGLVGRGVNIVSADFGWHCTDMFYRPSHGSTIPTLMQSMRLCGVFHDRIPLQCYMEQKFYDDLYKGNQLQEDVFQRLHVIQDTSRNIAEWLGEQHFLNTKMPKAKLTKEGPFAGKITRNPTEDEGMSLEEFFRDRCVTRALPVAYPVVLDPTAVAATDSMDNAEFLRLTNPQNGMFKKWASSGIDSAIARFMKHGLDPHKKYTREEMIRLCDQHGIHALNKIMGKGAQQTNTKYGILIMKNEGEETYCLHPRLVDAFNQHF